VGVTVALAGMGVVPVTLFAACAWQKAQRDNIRSRFQRLGLSAAIYRSGIASKSFRLGFGLQGFGDDGGDNNHQLAVAEVIVAADLLPEVGDAATGVYFLGPALGGDLLQIQRFDLAGKTLTTKNTENTKNLEKTNEPASKNPTKHGRHSFFLFAFSAFFAVISVFCFPNFCFVFCALCFAVKNPCPTQKKRPSVKHHVPPPLRVAGSGRRRPLTAPNGMALPAVESHVRVGNQWHDERRLQAPHVRHAPQCCR